MVRSIAVAALAALTLAAPVSAAAATSPAALIAPPRVCPGQSALHAAFHAQEQAMHCMTDFARRQAGRPPLATDPLLDRSAG